MDALKKYIETAARIIGRRSAAQQAYDREVLRWRHITKDLRAALAKANQKYPALAREVPDAELAELDARYEYIHGHEQILRRVRR
ncbi:MAG: hypothetical protein FJ382_09585 [Verrucomicrobia bacterium]|nr:hypothetical protein [Verrucomicrobiota bacterium]